MATVLREGTELIPHLRAWRKAKRMQIEELAKAAGLSKATIEKLEKYPTTRGARFKTTKALAGALGITADELVNRQPPAVQGSFGELRAPAVTTSERDASERTSRSTPATTA